MMMQGFTPLLGAVSFLIPHVFAQSITGVITDPVTGFKFEGAQTVQPDPPLEKGDLSFGVAFPKNLDKDEYIGYLTAARPKSTGWTGISHTSSMAKSLLLVAWADGQDVLTSFRYATDYKAPVQYKGTGTTLTQLAHTVNATHFSLTYRCQKCTSWDQGGVKGNQSMKGEGFLFGWAQGSKAPSQPKVATSPIQVHDVGFGVLPFDPKVAASASYDTMAAKGAASGGATPAAPKAAPPAPKAAPPTPEAAPVKGTAAPPKGTTVPAKGSGKGPAVPRPKGPPKGGPEMRFRK